MSTSYKIAEVAKRSGFNPSTLRYYEALGLVLPSGRTPAGYRLYDDTTLTRLAFISRAKQLGCSLDEITDLTVAWEGERCEPVQLRLRELVATKINDAQNRVAELVAFTAQLQRAAAALSQHTPDGPCDDDCGCTKPAIGVAPPIDCTLDAADMPARLADWQAALASAVSRESIDNGVRLTFPPGTSLGALADLIIAEQECCMFFRFAITVDARGAALEVTAPPEAIDLVHTLVRTRL